MRYAVISDIHGNLHALEAVLADAGALNIDKYFFIGDYYMDFPWPNEVTETVRRQKNAVVIQGNKEEYLVGMYGKDQSDWIYDQLAPLYWNFREFTAHNLNYLISLPKNVTVKDEGGNIYLSHSMPVFFRKPKLLAFHSSNYLERMEIEPFTHEEYLTYTNNALFEHPEAMRELDALPAGVYTFGHNHLAWYMHYKDKLFINPGSCGMPLDFDTRASYAIIEYTENKWQVYERRVPFDLEKTIDCLKGSELYRQAKIWSNIMMYDLREGRDYIGLFLRHVESIAVKKGYTHRPVSNEIWREAADTFTKIQLSN